MPEPRYSAPEYDTALAQFINRVLEGFFSVHPLFGSMVKEHSVHAGPVRNVRGPVPLDQQVFPVSGSGQLHRDQILNTDLDAFTRFIYDIAEETLKQFSRHFYRGLDEITEATGQKFDAGGRPFSYDMYLDVIEKMPIAFDDNGKPILPTLVVGQLPKDANSAPTDEQRLRLERILSDRKREFDAKKRTRRLF
jgi:hypothetical protein